MPFTEPAFLFYFLPATLAAYRLAPVRLKNSRGAPARGALVLHDLMRGAVLSVFTPTSERWSTWSCQAMLDLAPFAGEASEAVTFERVDRTLWEGLPEW